KYLFIPMAESVVFAMLASYLLSRTLIPTLSMYWLKKHSEEEGHAASESPGRKPLAWMGNFQRGFEHRFEHVRERYHIILEAALQGGMRFALIFLGCMVLSAILAFPAGHYLPGLGQDFFPIVDAGQ